MTLRELAEQLEPYQHVYITGHIHPDGDCIGSTMALAGFLSKIGIDTRILLKEVPITYDYLDYPSWVVDSPTTPVDALIVLDSGDLGRIGEYSEYFEQAAFTVNIDHHSSNIGYAMSNFVDPHASSTSEMVFRLVQSDERQEWLLDDEIAKAIYTGIVYDTGAFKHSSTSRLTHEIAGILIEYDFNPTEIIDRLFYYKTVEALNVQSEAIKNMKFYHGGKTVISYITSKTMRQLNAEKKDIEGVVQMLNDIEGVECAVYLYGITDELYKVSLRSKDRVNVCEIAKAFEGGGHQKASGCTLNMSIDEAFHSLLNVIDIQLNELN